MNSIFKGLIPNDFLNAYLVINKVRNAFLLQNFDDNDFDILKRISKIKNIFPNLYLLKSENYFFLSIEKLYENDINTEKKIANILRFKTDIDFDKLDKEKETISFNFIFDVNEQEPINLITYVCQTDKTKNDAELFLDDIIKAINKDNILKEIVKVDLKIERFIPPKSLIPKLLNLNYTLNQEEIHTIGNVIFNIMNPESIGKIINSLDYKNPIHRGLILGFISDYEYDTLTPFYPLQTTGYSKDIYEIDEKKSILLEQILMYK